MLGSWLVGVHQSPGHVLCLYTYCCSADLQAKGDSSASLKQRYSRVSGGGLLDSTGRRPWASGRAGEEAGGGGEAPPALRARVLPGSEQFDPQLYLGTIHAVGLFASGGWWGCALLSCSMGMLL